MPFKFLATKLAIHSTNPKTDTRADETKSRCVFVVLYSHTHHAGGRIAFLADPAVSRLLRRLLQRGIQANKMIAEPTLVTPKAQTEGHKYSH